MLLSSSRYRLRKIRYKYGIPVFLIFYLFMVWMGDVVGYHRVELFPFFSWKLFSNIPGWHRVSPAVVVHSIDGQPVAEHYLIPNVNNLDRAALKIALRECRYRFDECNEIVKRHLYPIVNRQAKINDVEFSIVTVRVDLLEVQRDIDDLAQGKTRVDDYYRRTNVVGRWTTGMDEPGINYFQFPPPGDERWDAISANVSRTKPVISADFDIYFYDEMLVYVKRDCQSSDLAKHFFLHVWPVDEGDLPNHRKQYGFDNLDFKFTDAWFRKVGEECMVVRSLRNTQKAPQYAVDRIRTGQFKSGRVVWEGAAELADQRD